MDCRCEANQIIEVIGLCDVEKTDIHTSRQWTQISISKVLTLPHQKPNIESIEKVFENVKIISKRIVNTPNSHCVPNMEGNILTGKKLIIEGVLEQKIIYTADEVTQSVHSAHFSIPFSAFIVVDGTAENPNEFCVESCIEDVFVKPICSRKFFKNVILLLNAENVPDPC